MSLRHGFIFSQYRFKISIMMTSASIVFSVIYLTCTLTITTLSMVLTVLVLNLYGIGDRPVPGWIKHLILIHLARLLGMCSTALVYREQMRRPSSRRRLQQQRGKARQLQSTLSQSGTGHCNRAIGMEFFLPSPVAGDVNGGDEMSVVAATLESSRNLVSSTPFADLQPSPETRVSTVNSCWATTTTPFTAAGGGGGAGAGRGGGVSDEKVVKDKLDYSKDWKRVAEIFDRFFFWLFFFAIILSTLFLFHPLLRMMTYPSHT